jgi:signal peptidase II
MDRKQKLRMYLPFSLTFVVVFLDQLTKIVIDSYLEVGERIVVFGDFLWLWHVRNKGMAFSLGNTLPSEIKSTLFLLLPVAVLLLLLIYYFRSKDISNLQRWCFAAILGGGLGNLLDRFLRPSGVIDFVSVKFYGLLGLERYPTFNLADSSVVVAGIMMIISYLTTRQGSTE